MWSWRSGCRGRRRCRCRRVAGRRGGRRRGGGGDAAQRFGGGAGFTDDDQIIGGGEEVGESTPDQFVIIEDEDADGLGAG